jgi:phytoene/squalene synthetase
VAGVVGLLAAGIFGYRNPRHARVRAHARHRVPADEHHSATCGEDARKNRIYLPMEDPEAVRRDCGRHPCTRSPPSASSELMQFEARRA